MSFAKSCNLPARRGAKKDQETLTKLVNGSRAIMIVKNVLLKSKMFLTKNGLEHASLKG